MAVTAYFEVEYDVADEAEARKLAEGHAGWILSHPAVLAVAAGPEPPVADALPITERYLEDV